MSEESKTVSINFERTSEAPTVPVSGVWGGLTPADGMVSASFYHERGSIPNVISFAVDEEGRGNPNQGDRIARGDVTREIQVTAQMSPEMAISIGQWLIDKGKEGIERRGNSPSPSPGNGES